ncbi:sigma-54-dependent Fis family transcriptional regulator [candidate division FCPU426 bacterium]|nr:sigma-54-dependent Fis family transcriptional regulator [candidate division FCPU426 bacterium]
MVYILQYYPPTERQEVYMDRPALPKILVIDDEPEICWIMKKVLSENGCEAHTAFNGEQGMDMAEAVSPDLVFLDMKLPGVDGLEVLQRLKSKNPSLPVIILSAFDNVSAAVKAMKLGAYDYISKPLNIDEMLITLKNAMNTTQLINEVENLQRQIKKHDSLIWSCASMQKVIDLVDRIAPYEVTVFIRGESGTGKELIAEYIHQHSQRAKEPLVSIDCSALPENLVESELFGYEKGAFTGAHTDKPGRFELAHGGTLFLDEIGNLPVTTQVKLLRVLQERCMHRLGGKKEIEINVRLITATNTDIEKAIQQGLFREDLYHRLNEFSLYLPSLRERQEDIELLVQHFISRFNPQFEKSVKQVSPEAMNFLKTYAWPGNVRELMNVIKRAVIMAQETIEFQHLPIETFQARQTPIQEQAAPIPSDNPIRPLKEICQEVARRVERETISRVLQETRWNKVKTARLLQINYKTLFNKMRELGI